MAAHKAYSPQPRAAPTATPTWALDHLPPGMAPVVLHDGSGSTTDEAKVSDLDAGSILPGATTTAHPGEASPTDVDWDWDSDPANPFNWSSGKKWGQIAMASAIAFAGSVATSIVSPALPFLMSEFSASQTLAIIPLSLYVLAMGMGPVVGGPLSETVGRHPVYMLSTLLGGLFTVGAGLAPNLASLSVLRFLAGFCLGPPLAVASGTITEVFRPREAGLPAAVFILVPFLGPGLGPVIGAFVSGGSRGWRWTMWTVAFCAAFALLLCLAVGRETYHPVLKARLRRRREKERGKGGQGGGGDDGTGPRRRPSVGPRVHAFVTVALARPLHMLVTEPVVGLVCLYVACEFATLFSFFAAVPYVFGTVYRFTGEQSGLVFIAVVVGCLLGMVTIILCEVLFYRKQLPRYPPHMVPPEYRLYPAMIGSVGLPLGLFWFAWTANASTSWASPAVAIVPFAGGNLCIFVSLIQYTGDVYPGGTIASAISANSFLRYTFAAAFPLFTIQLYERLGIGWAASLLGFIALVLMPVPWVFFRFGKRLRLRSRYETNKA